MSEPIGNDPARSGGAPDCAGWCAIAALLLVLAGCTFDQNFDGTRFRCGPEEACPAGTRCSGAGFCEPMSSEPDGGVGADGGGGFDGGGAAGPSFVQEVETSWTSAPGGSAKATASFEVLAGDVLVAFAATEDTAGVGPVAISGGGLVWTERARADGPDYCLVVVWTAEVSASQAMAVSFTSTDEGFFGGAVLTFRGAAGAGASAQGKALSGSPMVDLTTTAPRSAIVVAIGDWTGADGASRMWFANAGPLTETSYVLENGAYAVYGGYHPDAGAAAAYPIGLSSPADQRYSIAAVEIRGQTD